MSDGAIEDVPDRFIAEFEIQRDAEPFSSGSSGKVYRGIWRGAKVVIKYVEVTTHEEMRSFLHEGKIWHMARHPNVVTYFGACHLPRPCFLVSDEAVNGSSVNYIAREKVRGRSVLWRLMHEAALGLRFLHDSKIIHGDLACRNILVDTNGSAKLVDFGMSFLKDSSPTVYVGPIRWTAPECVLRNQTPSFQSDLYSIGMCIIEAAIGRDPWGNLSDIEVHYKLAHQEFLAQPAELNDDQWRLVTSLCAFDPNQRCSLDDAIDQLTALALAEATTYTTRPQRNHRRTSI
ncbi:TKL protein kinase [Phytophthora megakarya]|uniref:TKL protein kinase n=1 Tax=Phytophthora megakarya TaxID=4795 RepID=A0A225UUI0_9STRA|nr:TKL protein kinase [Phytophthora megakarya]